MTLNLIPFEYNQQQVRVVVIDGNPWFVAKDVCDVLDIGNSRQAVDRLDEDEKGVTSVDTLGGSQAVTVVSEPGLYSLVMTSRKPEARLFRRWVTHEVVPAIRKTGAYVAPAASLEDLIIMQAQSVKELKARVDEVGERALAAHHRIDSLDAANIQGDPRQRLEKMIRKYAWSRGILFAQAWREFDGAYNMAFHANLTAQRQHYAERNGLRRVTRPEYLAATDRLPDAIRVADKMLAGDRSAVN